MGKYSMLSIDKVFHASVVLKNIVRDTAIVPTEGITEDCQLFYPEVLAQPGIVQAPADIVMTA